MSLGLLRTAGYLLPTGFIVMALHLDKERSLGQAVDGALSSLWFAGCYLAGHLAGARSFTVQVRPGVFRHLIVGTAGAILGWGLLWAAWLVLPESIRRQAFLVNSLVMLVVGFIMACEGTGRRRNLAAQERT